jgi:ATP-dependent phosphofructokinase / diphosphate-dependent phosphofructokinase
VKKSRIGVLTGGGDCAGINPAVKWIVKTALDYRLQRERGIRYDILGIRDGWEGLIFADTTSRKKSPYLMPLDEGLVRTWDRYGGTNLGTSRTNPYNPENDRSQQVLENIDRLGLDVLIVIGGDDTLGVAYKLSQQGVNVVGIPKTIDKDLWGTDYTLGFETAVEVITEIVDKLRTTAGSHKRIFVVETMGRYSGWLALEGGESCGAYIILIPEYAFSVERVNQLLLEARNAGTRYDIVLVAEGAQPVGGARMYKEEMLDSFGHKLFGGISDWVAKEIHNATGFETRSVVLSHIQRGGAPCAYDRRLGRYFGIAAMDMVVNKDFGNMVSLKNGRVASIPFKTALGKTRLVDIKGNYDTERYSGHRTLLDQYYRRRKKQL